MAGIESVEVVPGRCEIVDEGQAFPVIVDEAATPEAFSRLLDMVKEVGARRVFTVFGCEGDRDKAIRPILGEIAHYKVSKLISLPLCRRLEGRVYRETEYHRVIRPIFSEIAHIKVRQ